METDSGNFVSANDTGSDPLVADTDGDGYNDSKVTVGTDPNSPDSFPISMAPMTATANPLGTQRTSLTAAQNAN